jgi:hypothetical protein
MLDPTPTTYLLVKILIFYAASIGASTEIRTIQNFQRDRTTCESVATTLNLSNKDRGHFYQCLKY